MFKSPRIAFAPTPQCRCCHSYLFNPLVFYPYVQVHLRCHHVCSSFLELPFTALCSPSRGAPSCPASQTVPSEPVMYFLVLTPPKRFLFPLRVLWGQILSLDVCPVCWKELAWAVVITLMLPQIAYSCSTAVLRSVFEEKMISSLPFWKQKWEFHAEGTV